MININDGFEGIKCELAEGDYLERLYTNYSGCTSIYEAISEVADSFARELTQDELLANIYYIEDCLEKVIDEGLVNMNSFSVNNMFQCAFYEYLVNIAYENITIIVENYLAIFANKNLLSSCDVSAIDEAIMEITKDDWLHNRTYNELEEALKEKLGM